MHAGVLDVFEEGQVPAARGVRASNPPCIVAERGEYTLEDWLRKMDANPSALGSKTMLFNICEALNYLHSRNIVHR